MEHKLCGFPLGEEKMEEKELFEKIVEETFESTKRFFEVHINMLEGMKLKLVREGKEERANGVQDSIDLLRDSIEEGQKVAQQMVQIGPESLEETSENDLGILSVIPEFANKKDVN